MTMPARRGLTTAATAIAALLLLSALLPAFQGRAGAAGPPPGARLLLVSDPFTATVLQGPDRGLSLTGRLQLHITRSTGAFTGQLLRISRQPLPVTGQIRGQLIGLYFDLGNGQAVFGTGLAGYDRAHNRNVIGGTFTGPQRASTGAWDGGVKGPGGCLIGIKVLDSRPGLGGYICYTAYTGD